MIYICSPQNDFALQLQSALKDKSLESQLYGDKQSLGSALKSTAPEGIFIDLRYETQMPRLLEKTYLDTPEIVILGMAQANYEMYGEFIDQVFFSNTECPPIAESFIEHFGDRRLLKSFGLIGRSIELIGVARMVEQVGPADISVLISGPSGAGKELIARAIHQRSGKPEEKFVGINISSLAPGVIESELFGHEKGSFTGAIGRRLGHFEMASGGTLFIDEIGELPLDLQVKLLRVLEEKCFYRVGGEKKITTDARLIFATNRNLADEVAAGRFRQDLYYRLNVVNIMIPPLSARPKDIPPLVKEFVGKSHYASQALSGLVEPGAMKLLLKYHWPGNVRELRNVVESLLLLSEKGVITQVAFEKYLREKALHDTTLPVPTGRTPESAEHQLIIQAILSLKDEISSMHQLIVEKSEALFNNGKRLPEQNESLNLNDNEKLLIAQTLKEAGGNRKRAAALLGIGERTLYRKLDKYGLR